MATPTIIASGGATYATAVTLPAGLQHGDIILVSLTNADYVVENITPPAGYKLLREFISGSGEPTQSGVPAVLYKKLSSADSGSSFGPITFPNVAFGSNSTIISYVIVRGGDTPILDSFLWSSVSTAHGAAASVSVPAQTAFGPSLQVMALTASGNGQAFSISGTGWSLDSGSYVNRWQPQAQWASCAFPSQSAGSASTVTIASANAFDPFITVISIPEKMEYAYQSAGFQADAYAGQPLTSQASLPITPFNLAVTRFALPVLQITWTGSANGTFEIQRSPDGTSGWVSLAAGIVPASYLDTTTQWGVTYYYQVRATNSAGSTPWSATFAVTNPVKDDGDWLYLNADVIPTLVEVDGDWLYFHSDVIPTLVESDGDRLYLNANITGFLVTLIPGAFWRGYENVGFPVSPDPSAYWRALENIGFPVPVVPDAVWLAYENIGFPVPVAPAAFWLAYENVGALGGRKQPTPVWGVGFLRIAPRDIDPITVATFYAMVDVTI